MAVKWTTIFLARSTAKVTLPSLARLHAANLFLSCKAEIVVKTRQVFSSHTACVGWSALRNCVDHISSAHAHHLTADFFCPGVGIRRGRRAALGRRAEESSGDDSTEPEHAG